MEEELDQLNSLKDQLIVYLVENGMRIVIAALIIVLGFWLGKSIGKIILKICEKREIDLTLARFFADFAKLVIIAFAVIIALSKAGIEITPFVALLGASAFGASTPSATLQLILGIESGCRPIASTINAMPSIWQFITRSRKPTLRFLSLSAIFA